MHKAFALSLTATALIVGTFTSCSNSGEKIQLATGQVAAESQPKATELYQEVQQLSAKGRNSKAAKLSIKLADKYPLSQEAPKARLFAADQLHQQGDLIKSFEQYQKFIEQHRGTAKYNHALAQQAVVAHAGADGTIQNSFLGLKSDIPRSKAETMLQQVRDNAPFAMWQRDNNFPKAILAYEDLYVKYPKSDLAPEALLRVGQLLIDQTEKGNRNRGNLDTALTTFTDLTLLYPNSKQAKVAKEKIKFIEKADIQRSFSVAEFYAKKKQYSSAAFYYREVLRETAKGSEMHKIAQDHLDALPKQ
jgi:outer membrane protein assembly factor BamD